MIPPLMKPSSLLQSKTKTRAQQLQSTPGGSYKRGTAKAPSTAASSSSVFKTPSSRVKTPANNRGGKMASLRSGRQIPFIL